MFSKQSSLAPVPRVEEKMTVQSNIKGRNHCKITATADRLQPSPSTALSHLLGCTMPTHPAHNLLLLVLSHPHCSTNWFSPIRKSLSTSPSLMWERKYGDKSKPIFIIAIAITITVSPLHPSPSHIPSGSQSTNPSSCCHPHNYFPSIVEVHK